MAPAGRAPGGDGGGMGVRGGGWRRGRADVRDHGGAARPAGARRRARQQARQEDPDVRRRALQLHQHRRRPGEFPLGQSALLQVRAGALHAGRLHRHGRAPRHRVPREGARATVLRRVLERSEEHTSELQSLMRISYAVFCLKKKKYSLKNTPTITKASTNDSTETDYTYT